MQTEDVIIIGAGPAGIATAIQLKRFGIVPLLLEKNTTGGLLRNADL
ncbi:MAG: NAD(P)-binding domain-containing protein [Syntrophales bacterium]|nr:NAD(P)-binding domain-containing protein [Syntrophales bacterium]